MLYPPDEIISRGGELHGDFDISGGYMENIASPNMFVGSSQRRPNLRSSGRVKDQRLRSKEGYDLAVFIEMDDGGGDVFLSGRVSPRLPESGGRIVFRLSLTKEQRWVARNGEWLYNGTSVVQHVQRRDGFRVEGVVSTRKPESDCCWITIGDLDGGVYCLGKWCPGGITPPLGARVSFELKKGKYGDWRVASPPGLIIISQFEVLASELEAVGLDTSFFRTSTAALLPRQNSSPGHRQVSLERSFDNFEFGDLSNFGNQNGSGSGGAQFNFLQDDDHHHQDHYQENGWNENSLYNIPSFTRSSSQLSSSFDRRPVEPSFEQQSQHAVRQQVQHEELPLHIPKQDPLFESTIRGTTILDQGRRPHPGPRQLWNDTLFDRNMQHSGNISHDSLKSMNSFEQQQEYQYPPEQRQGSLRSMNSFEQQEYQYPVQPEQHSLKSMNASFDQNEYQYPPQAQQQEGEEFSQAQLHAAHSGQNWQSMPSSHAQASEFVPSIPIESQVARSHDGLFEGKTSSVEPNSSAILGSSAEDNGLFSSSFFDSQFLFSMKVEGDDKSFDNRESEMMTPPMDPDNDPSAILVNAVDELALSETRSQKSMQDNSQSPGRDSKKKTRQPTRPSSNNNRSVLMDSSGAVRRINNRMTNVIIKAGIAAPSQGNGRLNCRFCSISFATSDSASLMRHFFSRHTSDAPPRTTAKARRAFQEWNVSNDMHRSSDEP
uniref:Uncharacterized protein n=1 Tax=Aureoumbra lagunensis TaxID=44058 RepID=A0A7S3NR62_9STRA|mmetsp:Transcript_6106/g.9071  ORF Transcript_6106/g.9071 Transcript_6106/m.9071 type:complete len:715 (+) Transcript_6106:72-2216(+)|eukprot:CAMPEP_0197320158 /NCGR_PEP_ID=MMETSP0891-20130614/57976_1 /TAXON_ID=44058 ORGANISM="Aureoumbra lagunensis, Strain CCMP1510" /NCGR_SAMPLE_ID=MMETSP0891 /ASSEMBLY_ACC=CAM_ASM_000534 /LENGTH=714 /DNA_ID=CAMNT_0042811407 /DNA_START=39 /DNA_END=2183 /DNA_ORIENTATION=+